MDLDKNNDGIMDAEITIDGHKVKTRDMFPDASSAMDFHSRLKLLKSPTGGERDMEAPGVEDQLFSPIKPMKKRAGDTGEADGYP